jgi:hypothetical protein
LKGGIPLEEKKKAPRGCTVTAEEGYRRIAFGKINDAVRLLLQKEPEPSELAKLDLYNVAEIKKRKEGVEIRFYDRMQALECLRRLDESGAEQTPLYRALMQSVQKEPEGKKNEV